LSAALQAQEQAVLQELQPEAAPVPRVRAPAPAEVSAQAWVQAPVPVGQELASQERSECPRER